MSYQPIPWMVYHLYYIGSAIIPRTNAGQSRFNIAAEQTNTGQSRFNVAAEQANTGQSRFNAYMEKSRTHQAQFVIRESLKVTN